MHRIPRFLLAVVALAVIVTGCGDDDTGGASPDRLTVVVTTNILGDVVENLVGDAVEVVTVMPVGADPHDFQASARQVEQMQSAAAVIVNGGGFEEGLLDVIEGIESDGTPVYAAITGVTVIEFGAGDHEDHDDHEGEEDHDDHEGEEDHDDHEGHGHSGDDPHFFTDPSRMAVAVDGIAAFLIANVDGIDQEAVRAASEAYHAELEALDGEVEAMLSAIPPEARVLVTNHEVFGYFADRYGFEVAATVIPSGSTMDGTSAGELADLADLLIDEGVSVVFSDTSASDQLAQTLADEVGSVAVVALFTESLGDADSDGASYIDMVRSNAERIAAALAS